MLKSLWWPWPISMLARFAQHWTGSTQGDLFDVKWLLENEGLTDEIRKALIVYLSSHNRPMTELLKRPQFKDISAIYAGEFANMAETDIPLEELVTVRERLGRAYSPRADR